MSLKKVPAIKFGFVSFAFETLVLLCAILLYRNLSRIGDFDKLSAYNVFVLFIITIFCSVRCRKTTKQFIAANNGMFEPSHEMEDTTNFVLYFCWLTCSRIFLKACLLLFIWSFFAHADLHVLAVYPAYFACLLCCIACLAAIRAIKHLPICTNVKVYTAFVGLAFIVSILLGVSHIETRHMGFGFIFFAGLAYAVTSLRTRLSQNGFNARGIGLVVLLWLSSVMALILSGISVDVKKVVLSDKGPANVKLDFHHDRLGKFNFSNGFEYIAKGASGVSPNLSVVHNRFSLMQILKDSPVATFEPIRSFYAKIEEYRLWGNLLYRGVDVYGEPEKCQDIIKTFTVPIVVDKVIKTCLDDISRISKTVKEDFKGI